MNKTKQSGNTENLYHLDGKIPVKTAIPFGLQHILAMFVANIAPISIVAGACGLKSSQTAMLIQCAMIIAGIGTLIQLFQFGELVQDFLLLWALVLLLYLYFVISVQSTDMVPLWVLC